MRILHCIQLLGGGGSDIGTVELVRSLNSIDGVEARLCVCLGASASGEYLVDLEKPVLLNFKGSHKDIMGFVRFCYALRGLVNDWRPDIIHSHLWPACRWSSGALLGVPVRHIWHIRDTRPWLMEKSVRSRLLRSLTRKLMWHVRPSFVAVSKAAASYTATALGLPQSQFHIVSSGVDPRRFQSKYQKADGRVRIGVIANFRPEKGHQILLKSVKRLLEMGCDCDVYLAGTGETKNSIEVLSHNLELDNRIKFLGHVKDIPDFLNTIDLFVLPSTAYEGLPLSIIEAMFSKTPVIATAVGGTSELVRDGISGYLVDSNDEQALTAGLRKAIADTSNWKRLTDNAYQLVAAHHSSSAVAQSMHKIYKAALR